MQPDLNALREATMAASNIQAPASTLGASNAPELASLYQSTFQLPQSTAAASAGANVAGDIVAQQKAAAAKVAASAEKKAADMADPKKYRRLKKSDGGYDFYDPEGNQVDIATLARRTGTKPADWIDDSENPIDIQYREDYKNLQDYISAKLGGDKKKSAKFEAARPELTKYQGQGGADQLINDFKKYYQRYYTARDEDPYAWGYRPNNQAFVPSSTEEDEYGLGESDYGL